MKVEKTGPDKYRISAPGGAFFNIEVDPDGVKNIVSGSSPPIGGKTAFSRYARLCDFTVVALTTPLQVLDALAKEYEDTDLTLVQVASDDDPDFEIAPQAINEIHRQDPAPSVVGCNICHLPPSCCKCEPNFEVAPDVPHVPISEGPAGGGFSLFGKTKR